MNSPVTGTVESGVDYPLRVPDGSGQGGPMAVALEADDPECSAVTRLVVVQDGAVHGLPGADSERPTPHQRNVHVEPDGVRPLSQQ